MMPLLDSGAAFLAAAAINDGPPTFFSNANARIAVGSGSDAFDETDTDLQGGSTARQGMESTYPQRVGTTLTFRALFGTGAANFAWNEWGIANAATDGVLLNRKVENLGTKADTQSWQFTAEVELINADATP